MSELTGFLRAEGAPVPDATVLAAEPGGDAALAASRTGPDGAFSLDVPGDRARIFAKAGAGEAVGLASRIVDLPAAEPVQLALEDHAPLHEVTLVAQGDVPPELDVQLTPRRIEGLDDEALSLLHAAVDGASEPMLVKRPIGAQGPVALRMQAGSWILYAALDDAPDTTDALRADLQHFKWRVERVTLDGGEELGPAVIGFALEVDRPLTVTLHVVKSKHP
jgi:hypothetical protein